MAAVPLQNVERWEAVQSFRNEIFVTKQFGVPEIPPDHTLVRVVAAGICGADIRIAKGDKTATPSDEHTVPGHEAVGLVFADRQAASVNAPELVVIRPHIYHPDHQGDCSLASNGLGPPCIGAGHSDHLGWDQDGVFGDFVCVPSRNVTPVATALVEGLPNSDLPYGSLLALSEPCACVQTGMELIESLPMTRRGRALVIGSGPMGALNTLALVERGWDVWITDKDEHRAMLLHDLLGRPASLYLETIVGPNQFDLVLVTASSASAISTGRALTSSDGVLYLFSGLNSLDRDAMDEHGIIRWERVHRTGVTISIGGERPLTVAGHSGYLERDFHKGIEMVARHSETLNRLVTGVIRGWSSPIVEARLPGAEDWLEPTGRPALPQVLVKEGPSPDRHIKILVTGHHREAPR